LFFVAPVMVWRLWGVNVSVLLADYFELNAAIELYEN
jgi:hypothetical protein